EIDRVRSPGASRALHVQLLRDGLLAESIPKQLKDLTHDRSFGCIDRDAVAERDALTMGIGPTWLIDWLRSISVGAAAGGVTLQEPAIERTFGGLSQIILKISLRPPCTSTTATKSRQSSPMASNSRWSTAPLTMRR